MWKNKNKVLAIIPAAGVGRRMGTSRPKQYLLLNGRPIIFYTLKKLCNVQNIHKVVVGIQSGDPFWNKLKFTHQKFVGVSKGGPERMNTVLNAIEFLVSKGIGQEKDWVLVHDAVRPCVDTVNVETLITCAISNGVGALLGLQVYDTLKEINEENQVIRTIENKPYWRAFTPQIFPLGLLRQALIQCVNRGMSVTDESIAMEMLGMKPEMVESNSTNFKITNRYDLNLAQMCMRKKK